MRELLLILTLLTAFTFLSCSKEKVKNEEANKTDSEALITKNENVNAKKSNIEIYNIANYEYVYEKNSDGEVLVSKTGYSADGKKVVTIDFVEEPGFSITIYEYNDKNQLIKSTTLFSDPQNPESKDTLKYTVTYTYDKEGKELGFRLDGDYAFEPAPNVFEYVYEKGNKPIKRFDYMEDDGEKTLFLQFILNTIKMEIRWKKKELLTTSIIKRLKLMSMMQVIEL